MKKKQGPALNLQHSKDKPDPPEGEPPEEGEELPEELFQAVASEEYKRIMQEFKHLNGRIDALFVLFGSIKGEGK